MKTLCIERIDNPLNKTNRIQNKVLNFTHILTALPGVVCGTMTAVSGRVSFLVTIIIILHLNIDSCSGNTRKHNLVEAKAKNASLVKHADGNIAPRHSGTMANKLHCLRWGKINKSTFENGQDYQQSMDTDAGSPPGDRTMDARVHYCRQCVIGTRQQPFICRDCATTDTSAAPFTCNRCRAGTPAQPFTCRKCTQDNPDLDSTGGLAITASTSAQSVGGRFTTTERTTIGVRPSFTPTTEERTSVTTTTPESYDEYEGYNSYEYEGYNSYEG